MDADYIALNTKYSKLFEQTQQLQVLNNSNNIFQLEMKYRYEDCTKKLKEKETKIHHLEKETKRLQELLGKITKENTELQSEIKLQTKNALQWEQEAIKEKAIKRGDIKVINLRSGNEFDTSKIIENYKDLRDNNLTLLVYSLSIKEGDNDYLLLTFSRICFSNILDTMLSEKADDNEVTNIAKQVLLGNNEFLDSLSTGITNNMVEIIVQKGIVFSTKKWDSMIDFCHKCIILCARMILCKPTLSFFTPTVGSIIGEYDYEYFDSKPIVKQLRYPGIKASDNTVLVKAIVAIKYT